MAANSLLYLLLATGLTNPPEDAVTTESNYDVVTRHGYDHTREDAKWRFRWHDETTQDYDVTRPEHSEYTTEDPHDEFVTPSTRGEEDSVFWPFNRKTYEPPHRTVRPEPHRRTERPDPPHRTERPEPPHRTERPEPPHRTERPEPPHHTKSEKDSVYWPFDNEEETEEPVDVTDENGWPSVTEDPEDVTQRPVNKRYRKGEEDSVFWPFNRKTTEPPYRTIRPEPHRRTERPEPHRRTERPDPPHRTERPEPPHRTERPEPPHRTERPEPPHHTKGEKDSVYWSFGNEEETEEPVDVTDENGWPRVTEDPEDATQRPVHKKHKKSGRTCPGEKEYPAYSCDKFCSKKKPCRRSKVKKCVCAGGYARHENGTCVRREFCGKKHAAEPIDSDSCDINSCNFQCALRREGSGKCVGNTCECHKNDGKCPDGETLSDCKGHCQKTCENFLKPMICPDMCIPGCVCAVPGFVRNSKGNCVHRYDCENTHDTDIHEKSEAYKCSVYGCNSDCFTRGKGVGKCENGTCRCERN